MMGKLKGPFSINIFFTEKVFTLEKRVSIGRGSWEEGRAGPSASGPGSEEAHPAVTRPPRPPCPEDPVCYTRAKQARLRVVAGPSHRSHRWQMFSPQPLWLLTLGRLPPRSLSPCARWACGSGPDPGMMRTVSGYKTPAPPRGPGAGAEWGRPHLGSPFFMPTCFLRACSWSRLMLLPPQTMTTSEGSGARSFSSPCSFWTTRL